MAFSGHGTDLLEVPILPGSPLAYFDATDLSRTELDQVAMDMSNRRGPSNHDFYRSFI